jgi:hypothetical protein
VTELDEGPYRSICARPSSFDTPLRQAQWHSGRTDYYQGLESKKWQT